MRTQEMNLKDLKSFELIELSPQKLQQTTGGGPIREALEWYYKTMGSFYHGLWDGLTGQEAKV